MKKSLFKNKQKKLITDCKEITPKDAENSEVGNMSNKSTRETDELEIK